jgi:Protein of unknown function (DUF2721)
MAFPLPTSPLPPGMDADSVYDVAHLIQTALTPVFMLSGIGTLLNLFNTRLARVSDHMERVHDLQGDAEDDTENRQLARRLMHLRRRTLMLDASILFGGIGGAMTCAAALMLFLGSVRDTTHGAWLVYLFGVALLCTVLALAMFLGDSVLAWHILRTEGPMPRAKNAKPA